MSGAPSSSAVASAVMTDLCSAASRDREEPLAATASRVERWLLVEHRGAWGPESVPTSRMSRTVARALAQTAATARARMLLVRRPAGQPVTDGRWVLAVDSRPGSEVVLRRHVTDDLELASLVPPYGVAAADGWERADGPVYLVCTHGRHDRCCALRGRPVARALAAEHGERVWESTHVGGDRFAANLVVLPEGLYVGRVDADEAVALVDALAAGTLPAGQVRGRSSLPLPTQAGQQFAREHTGRWGVGDLLPVVQEGAGPDAWRIVLSGGPGIEVVVRYDRHGDGGQHLLTCDADEAKAVPLFRLVSLTPVGAPAAP
ncbi:MAG: putative sucraseferredoxin [Frankiales bacterium]|nr:putative sucraseferredoxin [Frankiales bacterium]